ncbi:MAG TPA: nicotinate phosphoribosyltransferase [Persephonella sp.]|nr:nicotinate phosphoribosyltransferase [Hydrogenothermaceae bacterium]HIQ24440.1 nicotinate phosphoribosyltransferase [Persephonella sp.]
MEFGFVNKSNMSMVIDLYELTMAQVYFNENHNKTAVFDFFVRPTKKRPYFIFAGLEQLLYYVQNITFIQEDLDFLKSTNLFNDDFLHYLSKFKFTGNLYAFEEGEFFFANEPVVIIEAPLIEAQIIETFLINTLQIQILVATKALRCYSVANGKLLVDFGLRRAHGVDAGLKSARASYIGGFFGTSNVLAGKLFNIPIVGTIAHSFILSFESEEKAFEAFAKNYPENTVLLIDTFNTIEGAKKAVETAKKLGIKLKGVRIDSGNLLELSRKVRKILDENNFKDSIIIASGGIDEYKIKYLEENNAPINSYGVGTKLVVSADVPYLDCAYKLVQYNDRPVMKLSSKKIYLPSKKQVFRSFENEYFKEDIIGLFDERLGKPMLKHIIKDGNLVYNLPHIKEIKEKAISSLKFLPKNLKNIHNEEPYTPQISENLKEVVQRVKNLLV